MSANLTGDFALTALCELGGIGAQTRARPDCVYPKIDAGEFDHVTIKPLFTVSRTRTKLAMSSWQATPVRKEAVVYAH